MAEHDFVGKSFGNDCTKNVTGKIDIGQEKFVCFAKSRISALDCSIFKIGVHSSLKYTMPLYSITLHMTWYFFQLFQFVAGDKHNMDALQITFYSSLDCIGNSFSLKIPKITSVTNLESADDLVRVGKWPCGNQQMALCKSTNGLVLVSTWSCCGTQQIVLRESANGLVGLSKWSCGTQKIVL